MTSIGLTSQLVYRNAKMSILNFVVQMTKEFSISSCFEPIDVVISCTIWWPQLHSSYHQPKVSSIYFMKFLWAEGFTIFFFAEPFLFSFRFNNFVIFSFLRFFSSKSRHEVFAEFFWKNRKRSRMNFLTRNIGNLKVHFIF